MSAIPSVNLIAVLVAAVVSFVSGGIYWGVIANPLTKLLGNVPEEVKMPPADLMAAFLTRVVLTYVLAIFLIMPVPKTRLREPRLPCWPGVDS